MKTIKTYSIIFLLLCSANVFAQTSQTDYYSTDHSVPAIHQTDQCNCDSIENAFRNVTPQKNDEVKKDDTSYCRIICRMKKFQEMYKRKQDDPAEGNLPGERTHAMMK